MDSKNNNNCDYIKPYSPPDCNCAPRKIKSIFLRKNAGGNLELIVDGKIFEHGTFEIIQKDNKTTVIFSY